MQQHWEHYPRFHSFHRLSHWQAPKPLLAVPTEAGGPSPADFEDSLQSNTRVVLPYLNANLPG